MKTNKVSLVEVDYNEIDKAVTDFLRKKKILNEPDPNVEWWKQKKINYECVAYEEWGNYQSHTIDIEAEMPEQYDMDRLNKGNLHYHLRTILNWMCCENEIEAGEYLISVSW